MTDHSSYITLEEASLMTGKSVHTLRKTVKVKNIPTTKEKKSGRLMLMLDKRSLENIYQPSGSKGTHKDFQQKINECDRMKKEIDFLRLQIERKDQELKSKNNQLARKDQQIMQLHVLLRSAQKECRFLMSGKKPASVE